MTDDINPVTGDYGGDASPSFVNGLQQFGNGLLQQFTTPGAAMQPNPYVAGSEEATWYDQNRQDVMNQWAPGMALNMLGASTSFAKPETLGKPTVAFAEHHPEDRIVHVDTAKADAGKETTPVQMDPESSEQMRETYGVAPPKQELPKYISAGPYAGETTPIIGKTLHHETSPENAAALIREDLVNDASRIRPSNMFLADNPDIAIGQSGRGVRLEYAGDLVSGAEHVKPGTGGATGREYRANAIGNGAIRRITVAPGEQMRLQPAWERRVGSSFNRQEMPDGSVVYAHKSLAAADDLAAQFGVGQQ